MPKLFIFLWFISYTCTGYAQNSSDSITHINNFNTSKIVLQYIVEAPYNIVNLIKRSFPELKIKTNEKIFFSYYKQDSTFFSIGRINVQNTNLNNNLKYKSGSLNGKIILPYQLKIYNSFVIIMISETNKFPISFEQ